MTCHAFRVPHSEHAAVQPRERASRRIVTAPQLSHRTTGNTFPPHATHGARSSTRTVIRAIPPESPSDCDRGERMSSDSRGILRPSRVAVATRIYSGSWTFARCYHGGFEDGAGRHPVRRILWPEHREDGERTRPLFEALYDRRGHRSHEGRTRRGRGPRREGERHPGRRESERRRRPPEAGDVDHRCGHLRRLHPPRVPTDPPAGDREWLEHRGGTPRIPDRGPRINATRRGSRSPPHRRSEATAYPRVETIQRRDPHAALSQDPGPRDRRGNRQ